MVHHFDRILAMLWDRDETVRETGLRELEEFQNDNKDPGSQVGVKSLRAAARLYLFETPEPGEVSRDLVATAAAAPRSEYVPVIMEHFDQFSEEAKREAQLILTKLETREATDAFMTIVRDHARSGGLPSLITWPLADKPRHAEAIFPELLNYADIPNLTFEINQLCLAYCEAGLIEPEQLSQCADPVISSYVEMSEAVRRAQQDQGIGWMWDEDYQELRANAALKLDLLGHFPDGRVERLLCEALHYTDPRLKYFAVVSLLRLDKQVENKHVRDIAAHAETRYWLFIQLTQLGRALLFPESFRTQEAFAESDMVNWLIYPTELNRVPDEIELMKVVSIETGFPDGIYDYYLFRFRTKEPHWAAKDGWLAGLSGPYLRKEQPTTRSLGDTFSCFEQWDSKSPDEHVGDTQELMQKWRDYHATNNAE